MQVVRARRQVKTEPPNRRNSGRSGAFSVLVSYYIVFILLNTNVLLLVNIYNGVLFALQGDPQNDGQEERPKRSIQKISSEK